MTDKILEKDGVDITALDDARFNLFCSGYRDGIVKGSFNECNFTKLASNVFQINKGLLLISGFRVNTELKQFTFNNLPQNPIRYQIVAQIELDTNNQAAFSMFITTPRTLKQNNLFAENVVDKVYQIEFGRFTLDQSGISDITRTLDVITGGGSSQKFGIGKIITEKIDYEMPIEADVDERYDEETNTIYFDIKFNLPMDFTRLETDLNNKLDDAILNKVGTTVIENGQELDSWNATTFEDKVVAIANGKSQSFTLSTLNDLGQLFNIEVDPASSSYSVITNQIDYKDVTYSLKNGDVFLIEEIDVPDFWFSLDDMKLFKLETTKVDLSNVVHKEGNEIIAGNKNFVDKLLVNGRDISTISDRIIGEIKCGAIPLKDAGLHLLDGSTISQTGIYAEFCAYLKSLLEEYPYIACTQAEFDDDVSRTGNCGKFVIDDTASTIRLPKITRYVQGLSSIMDIGKSLEAGLPNITGVYGDNGTGSSVWKSGSFKSSVAPTSWSYSSSEGGSRNFGFVELKFNADDGATTKGIYGNAETVQTQSTKYPYYIVLANSYKTDIEINIDNVVSDINLLQNNVNILNETISKTNQIEIIYNKNSNDASINLGYTSGIPYNTTVNKDLSQYKLLIFYSTIGGASDNEWCPPPLILNVETVVTVDYTGLTVGNIYSYQGKTYCVATRAVVNPAKTSFKNLSGRYRLDDFDYDDLGGIITKIEAIKK